MAHVFFSDAGVDDYDPEDIPQLLRTRSDASFVNIQRRSKMHNSADSQRIKRHRFSINGHFYNHKVMLLAQPTMFVLKVPGSHLAKYET